MGSPSCLSSKCSSCPWRLTANASPTPATPRPPPRGARRYRRGGWPPLRARRSHHSPPHKTAPAIEREVVRLRRRNPRLGQDKIQVFLTRRGVHLSTAPINRILHAYALIK